MRAARLRVLPFAMLLVVPLFAVAAQPGPFQHAGFSRQTPWSGMIDQFPHSTHEFWESQRGTTYQLEVDGREKFQRVVATGSGKYLIRLSQDESRNDIYFIEFQIARGSTAALKLSFEKPAEFMKTKITSNAQRYPACEPVLSSFTMKYGNPTKTESNTEEALTTVIRTSTAAGEQLALSCGHYDGQKKTCAMDVTVSSAN